MRDIIRHNICFITLYIGVCVPMRKLLSSKRYLKEKMCVAFSHVITATVILTLCKPGCGQDSFFTKTPGVVRTYQNEPAIFGWILDKQVNRSSVMSIDYLYGSKKICTYFSSTSSFVGYTFSPEQYSCFANASFELVQQAELYTGAPLSINITLDRDGTTTSQHNANAFVFIYQKPDVHTEYPSNITAGDTVNITCNATSASLPVEYRQPITLEWTYTQQLTTQLTGSTFVISGPQNGTLTITNIQPTHADVACIATERGSKLKNIKPVDLVVTGCVACDENEVANADTTIMVKKGSAWILGGIAIAVFLVLLSVIIYLVWERKHRPERSKRRSRAVRLSLGRPLTLPRRGRQKHNVYSYKEGTSSDSDSDHYYDVIPSSRVASTIDGNACPTLPERDPNMMQRIARDDPGCYDYADSRLNPVKLNSGTSPDQTKQLRASDIYGEDVNSAGAFVQKDVDGYMAGVDLELGHPITDYQNRSNRPTPSTNQYAVVNKPKKETDHEIVECPLYIPMEHDTAHTDQTEQNNESSSTSPPESIDPSATEYHVSGNIVPKSPSENQDGRDNVDSHHRSDTDDEASSKDTEDLNTAATNGNNETTSAHKLTNGDGSNANNLDLYNLAEASQDELDTGVNRTDLYEMANES